MTAFVLLSALLIVSVLIVLLRPLLRGRGNDDASRRRAALKQALDAGVLDQEEYANKLAALEQQAPVAAPAASSASRTVLVAIAILLPLGVFGLYRWVGRPDAVHVEPATPPKAMTSAVDAAPKPGMDMDKAIESLRAKLEKNPDDAEGWLLLGRAYESVGRNEDGNKALAEAYKRAPTRPDVEIAYAESIALTSASRRIEGEPLRMIRHALEQDPNNQDGLWLLGMSEYQNGRYAEAIASWEKIRAQLGPDSDVLASVTEMIENAKAHLQGKGGDAAMPAAALAQQPPQGAATGPRLRLRVELSAEQRARAAAKDVVFVFAKAVGGPPMPLAIRRLQVSQLPAEIELTDADAMVPEMRLSKFPKVLVGARVSKSGDAAPRPGDLETGLLEVEVANTDPLVLSIDRIRR
ncbi:MAG: tetratricopeptide repeat protein [Lysobacteraceae bacterium]|nr:MAG: tetratricopeptide repeat protein [Xanthomonadaceae bacterium]